MSQSITDLEYAMLKDALGDSAVGTIADLRRQFYESASLGLMSGVQEGGLIGPPVEKTFAINKPTPAGASLGLYFLTNDLINPNRIWVQGLDFGQIGFTDDFGSTWSVKAAFPGVGNVQQMTFKDGFTYLVTGENVFQTGQIWRSPLPDANGNGIAWTKILDLAAPTGPMGAVGNQAFFRPQCLAINGPNLYAGEYGGTIAGGPVVYYSPDFGANWTRGFRWDGANLAKHIHSVEIINGAPVVMLGDAGSAFTGIGLYRGTALNASTFQRISTYSEANGGNTLYGIAGVPIVIDGKQGRAYEYDGAKNRGPLILPYAGDTVVGAPWPFQEGFELPLNAFGTMRTLTSMYNGQVLVWVQTTENHTFGDHDDSIWASVTPFKTAVRLATFPGSTMVLGSPVTVGNKACFGNYVADIPRFYGLAA